MCDGILVGMVLGAVAGAILVQTCKPVKDAIEKGKQKIKDQVAKMQFANQASRFDLPFCFLEEKI